LAEIGSFWQSTTIPNFIAVLPHQKILFILAFSLVLFFFFFATFCNEMIFGMNIWYFDGLADISQTLTFLS